MDDKTIIDTPPQLPSSPESTASPDAKVQLDALTEEVNQVSESVERTSQEARAKMGEVSAKVDKSVDALEEIFGKLDEAEKQAGSELDRLMQEQTQTLTNS